MEGIRDQREAAGKDPADDLREREQDVDRDREDQLAITQVLLAVTVAAMPTMCVLIAHVRN